MGTPLKEILILNQIHYTGKLKISNQELTILDFHCIFKKADKVETPK